MTIKTMTTIMFAFILVFNNVHRIFAEEKTVTLLVEGNTENKNLRLVRNFLLEEFKFVDSLTIISDSIREEGDCITETELKSFSETLKSEFIISVCVRHSDTEFFSHTNLYSTNQGKIISTGITYTDTDIMHLSTDTVPLMVKEIKDVLLGSPSHQQQDNPWEPSTVDLPETESLDMSTDTISKSPTSKLPPSEQPHAKSDLTSEVVDTTDEAKPGKTAVSSSMPRTTIQKGPNKAPKKSKMFSVLSCFSLGQDMSFIKNNHSINPFSLEAMDFNFTPFKMAIGWRFLMMGTSIWEWTARTQKQPITLWFPVHASIPLILNSTDRSGGFLNGLLLTAIYAWKHRWAIELEYMLAPGSSFPFSIYCAFEKYDEQRISFGVRALRFGFGFDN